MAKRRRTLTDCAREHKQLASQLAQIGFIWEGSISRRYLTCGNPRCACQHDKNARHGPYVYWTTKKAGHRRRISPAASPWKRSGSLTSISRTFSAATPYCTACKGQIDTSTVCLHAFTGVSTIHPVPADTLLSVAAKKCVCYKRENILHS